MFPHTGRRHYVYDRDRGSVVPTSQPAYGTTPRASSLAAGSYFLPTGRRVINDRGEWAPTDSATPTRAPIWTDQGQPNEEKYLQPFAMLDAKQEQRIEAGIAEAERKQASRAAVEDQVMLEPEHKHDELESRVARQPSGEIVAYQDLVNFLGVLGLDRFLTSLVSQGITSVERLAFLTENDWREIGLSMSERSFLREALVAKRAVATRAQQDQQNQQAGARQAEQRKQAERGASQTQSARIAPSQKQEMRAQQSSHQASHRLRNSQPTNPTAESLQRQREKYVQPPERRFTFDTRTPVVPRAAQIPSSPRHMSPQSDPSAYLAPTKRELTQPQRSHQYQPPPPPPPSLEAGPRRPLQVQVPSEYGHVSAPVSVRSPPLVHAADYPLDTVMHGDADRMHLDCGSEHEHNFEASRHPPHLSHPMPPAPIVPHTRQWHVSTHPAHPSHPPSSTYQQAFGQFGDIVPTRRFQPYAR